MAQQVYRATIEVELSDTMEEPPLTVLSSVVLGALGEAEITTLSVHFEQVRERDGRG